MGLNRSSVPNTAPPAISGHERFVQHPNWLLHGPHCRLPRTLLRIGDDSTSQTELPTATGKARPEAHDTAGALAFRPPRLVLFSEAVGQAFKTLATGLQLP